MECFLFTQSQFTLEIIEINTVAAMVKAFGVQQEAYENAVIQGIGL